MQKDKILKILKNPGWWLFFIGLIILFSLGRLLLVWSVVANYQTVKPSSEYYSPAVFKLPPELAPQPAPNIPRLIKNQAISSTTTNPNNKSIKLPILMYHYVEPLTGHETSLRVGLTTTATLFEQQLKTLKDNQYQTYFARDITNFLTRQTQPAPRAIVLTFDDGYEDFYTYVFPLLKKYQQKATVYVIYDAINVPNYLTEDQLKELLASGLVEVGSHTLDHTNLKLASPAEAKRQIFLSKELFEKRFKTDSLTFAYPFGAFTKPTADIVKSAGYQLAVSVMPGEVQAQTNQFHLLRLRPGLASGPHLLKLIQR